MVSGKAAAVFAVNTSVTLALQLTAPTCKLLPSPSNDMYRLGEGSVAHLAAIGRAVYHGSFVTIVLLAVRRRRGMYVQT